MPIPVPEFEWLEDKNKPTSESTALDSKMRYKSSIAIR